MDEGLWNNIAQALILSTVELYGHYAMQPTNRYSDIIYMFCLFLSRPGVNATTVLTQNISNFKTYRDIYNDYMYRVFKQNSPHRAY